MPRFSHRWRRIKKEPIDNCRYWRCGASYHNRDVAADLPYLVDAIKKAGQVLRCEDCATVRGFDGKVLDVSSMEGIVSIQTNLMRLSVADVNINSKSARLP